MHLYRQALDHLHCALDIMEAAGETCVAAHISHPMALIEMRIDSAIPSDSVNRGDGAVPAGDPMRLG